MIIKNNNSSPVVQSPECVYDMGFLNNTDGASLQPPQTIKGDKLDVWGFAVSLYKNIIFLIFYCKKSLDIIVLLVANTHSLQAFQYLIYLDRLLKRNPFIQHFFPVI